MTRGFILYRIYYDDYIAYLGRTKQPLRDRIRGHLFAKPMHRKISINLVSKIEFAEFKSEADMNVYEVYFINLFHPPLNRDDKAQDELTITLPGVTWQLFTTPLWERWRKKLEARNNAEEESKKRKKEMIAARREMRKKYLANEISEEVYFKFLDGT